MEINKQSSVADIILFLKNNKLDEIVEDFKANQVDGEDFFNLEPHDIYQMIPRIKLHKKFTCIWNDVTQKLKAELGRILEKSDVVQDMKERWNLNKYKMLSVIKKTKQKNISSILEELEDCPVEDEKEVKNQCIMTCLPYVLDDQCTHRVMNKKLFWDIVDGKSLGEVQEIINKSSSPGLLSTGTLRNIHSIMLVAEVMIVAKLKMENIVNAVTILLAVTNCSYKEVSWCRVIR
ncbi:uncharacterized protein LOC124457270 [Xenia sp. Carnegie-2017]|uniref:uncharacterized protein LOC124457270 n=1 Tax=Xenia sp. Carnegie-2017 TaxID=2897299 RepID=UPI001F03C401|nr:uncharacterized protein LOC124457270 [Xenia sp. Carnegie-2017]